MLVISPGDIKIKHQDQVYQLKTFPYIGFAYSYLYYEPEVNHYKKIVLAHDPERDSVGYQDDLTDNEKLIVQQFLASLDDPRVLSEFLDTHEKRADTINLDLTDEPPNLPKHAVDAAGLYQGQVLLPQPGLTEVPDFPPKDLYLEALGVAYQWDFDSEQWVVRGDYKEQRKHSYLNQIALGDQLDAIISAVDALSKNQPLPEKFNQLLTTITAIKQSNPKS